MTDQSTAPQPKSDDETQESVAIPEGEEELEGLPAKILEKISSKILEKISVTISQEFTGPIPPPPIMKQYEETLTGSADRILKMAENQSEHRQLLEKKMLSLSNREVHIGQVLGFLLVLLL